MEANEYQKAIMKYAPNITDKNEFLLFTLVGLSGEAGEALDLEKKVKWHSHQLDEFHMKRELGDVAWYLAAAAEALGVKLTDIFDMNIEKLEARYPNGFDPERSIHRKIGDV